jgi:5-enolpyruvylshikimate-3-phosphate synthase
MKYVTSSKLYGSIKVPVSKSIIQRMLIAEYLGAKHKEMDLTDASQDVVITYNALKKLKVTNEDIYLGETGF